MKFARNTDRRRVRELFSAINPDRGHCEDPSVGSKSSTLSFSLKSGSQIN